MIIYIAGPMSGHPQNNYPAFWLAANKFRAHGLKVLNPAELPILPDWQAYMRESLKMVAEATHIHFLPGADTSRGAQIESFIAKELGIEIIGHPCTQLPCDICDSYAEEHGTEHYDAAECSACQTVHDIGGWDIVQKDAYDCCGADIEALLICCKCESHITEEEAQTKCYECHIKAQNEAELLMRELKAATKDRIDRAREFNTHLSRIFEKWVMKSSPRIDPEKERVSKQIAEDNGLISRSTSP